MPNEIRIIAVDNNEQDLNYFRGILTDGSLALATANNINTALDIISKENIKVAICSQNIQEMSGTEFLKLLKEKYPDIIRILITDHADISLAQEAINTGEIYRFINKPWSSSEIKIIISQALKHYDSVIKDKELLKSTISKIEDLQTTNEEMRKMYESQISVSSTISHELRTPLASIKMAIDIVMSGTAGTLSINQRKFLTKAKNNIDRLKRLIDDILDLSKMESGTVKLNFRLNNVNKVIEENVVIQEPVAKSKGIRLKAKLDKSIPMLPFDIDKINQVMSNLLNNAIKFTSKGSVVVVSKRPRGANFVEICIADTGEGISKEDIPKVFEKFRQLGDPLRRKTGGTGLGLSICDEIIRQHAGKIWIESKLNRGTRVYVVLPIEERRTQVR